MPIVVLVLVPSIREIEDGPDVISGKSSDVSFVTVTVTASVSDPREFVATTLMDCERSAVVS